MAKKKYEITGPFETYGIAPGESGEIDLEPEIEAILIEQGAIKEVVASKATDKKSEPKQ
jgi:hypothetical protein